MSLALLRSAEESSTTVGTAAYCAGGDHHRRRLDPSSDVHQEDLRALVRDACGLVVQLSRDGSTDVACRQSD
jgi:hypothetical protein